MSTTGTSDTKKGIDLDELREEVEKLLALLKDREPGYMGWCMFMHERLINVHALTSKALGKDSEPVEQEVVEIKHLIDLNAAPYVPNGWSVVKHKKGGLLAWNPTKVKFHLSENQKGGRVIQGHKLRKELETKQVYNANLLDYLYAHQELIPEEWKKDENGNIRFTYFWGTIYRFSCRNLYVRCLCFHGGRWGWGCGWLGDGWGGSDPAAVPAS